MKNKERIAITIDPDLLARIDDVCGKRNEARSAMIERVLQREIAEEEGFVKDMENPLLRGLARAISATPGMMRIIAKIAGTNVSSEELEKWKQSLADQAVRGKERQRSKGKTKGQVEGA